MAIHARTMGPGAGRYSEIYQPTFVPRVSTSTLDDLGMYALKILLLWRRQQLGGQNALVLQHLLIYSTSEDLI